MKLITPQKFKTSPLNRTKSEGFSVMEVLTGTAVSGVLLLAVAQLAFLDSRVRQSARDQSDFREIRRELIATLTNEGTCIRVFTSAPAFVTQVPPNFIDPQNQAVDAIPTPLNRIFDGLNPGPPGTPNVFLQAGARRGSLMIAGNNPGDPGFLAGAPGISLEKVRVFSKSPRSLNGQPTRRVLVNMRVRTATFLDIQGAPAGAFGGPLGGAPNDVIPLVIEVDNNRNIVSCSAAGTASLTGEKLTKCGPGQIISLSTDNSGTLGCTNNI